MNENPNEPRTAEAPKPEPPPEPPPEQDVSPTPIRAAAKAVTPAPAKPEGGESVRPYINDQQNSRLGDKLLQGKWAIRWEATLDHENPCSFIMATGDRVALQCGSRWQLLSGAGKPVALGKLGPGDVVMEGSSGRFYVVDPHGVVETRRQNTGEVEYSISISGGDEWQRAFFATRGRDFAVVSFMRAIHPHTLPPAATLIEVDDLGEPAKVEEQILVSMKREQQHYFEAPRAYAAILGRDLVVSLRDQIVATTEFGRRLRARYTGTPSFGPLSLDETGRIHVLQENNGRFALWVLNPAGERIFAMDFPQDITLRSVPPVIGYDHRIYVSTRDTVICIGPEGQLLWRQSAGGAIAGMAVTADDHLVVAAGSALIFFNAKGDRQLIRDFTGESLRTPPAGVRGGDLMVASARKLYRVTAVPR